MLFDDVIFFTHDRETAGRMIIWEFILGAIWGGTSRTDRFGFGTWSVTPSLGHPKPI